MDEQNFKTFYEAMFRPLWGYVYRMTADRELAQDIAQDAFVRFFRRAPAGLPETASRSYLYRIATNLVYDHRRRYSEEMSVDDISESLAGPAQDMDSKMDFHRAFGKMNDRNRALLWLAYAENYSHEEISEILELKRGSIKVLLFRAKKHFLEMLQSLNSGRR